MKNSSAAHEVKKPKGSSKTASRRAESHQMKKSALESDLNRVLRDRIIAELDGSNIEKDIRVPYLASLTGCAKQTVRRWIADDAPGLPDLKSLVLLCDRFNSDANWMLGLVKRRYPLPKSLQRSDSTADPRIDGTPDWAEKFQSQLRELCVGYQVKFMIGDEMEPRIKNGAPIWVDPSVAEIQANGIYLLEYEHRILVRQVEIRVGEGLVLSCDNNRYKPTVIKDAIAAKKMGLTVLGLVKLSIALERL
jgi:hypothetical protein